MKKIKYTSQFKFKAAMDAAKEIKTLSELSSQYEVHSAQISQWKKHLLENGENLFSLPKKNTQY